MAMMKFARMISDAAVLACAGADTAAAQTYPETKAAGPRTTMTFAFTEVDARFMDMGLRQLVYADGVITPGTASRLASISGRAQGDPRLPRLNSTPRWRSRRSMQIGRLIRQRMLQTEIGRQGATPETGVCFSACTLAFLGGERRYAMPGTTQFGVHRFYAPGNTMSGEEAMDLSQMQSGEVVEYVNFMGVKPGFIAEMNRASPQQLNILSQEQMFDLNVLTRDYETKWEIKTANGEFYVLGFTTTDVRGTHKIIFGCPPFIMLMYNLSEGGQTIVLTAFLELRIDREGSRTHCQRDISEGPGKEG